MKTVKSSLASADAKTILPNRILAYISPLISKNLKARSFSIKISPMLSELSNAAYIFCIIPTQIHFADKGGIVPS